MTKKILMPLPSTDFDPTESGVPWKILAENKVQIVFATPHGQKASCDIRMLEGKGLGPLAPILAADKNGREAYLKMSASAEFNKPLAWSQINAGNYDGIILAGGHAKGMREYLESSILQKTVSDFFTLQKPVGAICHGTVLAARSKAENGKSVLYGKKTTALLASQELLAWGLTCVWLGDYYRTYPQTVEAEVKSNLSIESDFISGPMPMLRDSPENRSRGFTVRDQNYLSARWPGDAHLFAHDFLKMLN